MAAQGYAPYPPPNFQQQFVQQQAYAQPAYGGPAEPPPGWQPRGAQQMVQQVPHEETDMERKAKLTKPIDRNGVAPADVSIENMFYFGNKKK